MVGISTIPKIRWFLAFGVSRQSHLLTCPQGLPVEFFFFILAVGYQFNNGGSKKSWATLLTSFKTVLVNSWLSEPLGDSFNLSNHCVFQLVQPSCLNRHGGWLLGNLPIYSMQIFWLMNCTVLFKTSNEQCSKYPYPIPSQYTGYCN